MDQLEGFADEARKSVVCKIGYTVGHELGLTGRIPFQMWKRAERYHRSLAEKGRLRDFRIKPATVQTIRGWCARSGELADLYQAARTEAAAWTTPEPAKLLQS
jgi:hypothetical protein